MRLKISNRKKEEEDKPVDKIVIVTDKPGPDKFLPVLLNTLFPDCEIDIVSRGVETFEEDLDGCSHGTLTTDTTWRV